MGLHVGGISAKNLLDAVNRQLFGDIDKFAATVVAPARVAFGVLVGQLRALRPHHGGRGVVFAGDEFNVVLLARVFRLDGGEDFGVELLDKQIAWVHGVWQSCELESLEARAAQANG